jgi:NADH:ubiquinone oxidoreductase subunit 6 (subunit J)
MIKFFREIRQQLLTENRFSKYLLYAIGEIVLVVIGILIALQINNWNEAKKQEIKTKEIRYFLNSFYSFFFNLINLLLNTTNILSLLMTPYIINYYIPYSSEIGGVS